MQWRLTQSCKPPFLARQTLESGGVEWGQRNPVQERVRRREWWWWWRWWWWRWGGGRGGGGWGEGARRSLWWMKCETIWAAVCAHFHEGIHLLPHSVSKSPLHHQASGEGREGKEVILHWHTCPQPHLLNVFLLVSLSDRDVSSPWLQVNFNHLHHTRHDSWFCSRLDS